MSAVRKRPRRLADFALHSLAGLDLLVANAAFGRAPRRRDVEELWDRVLDSNLKGTWTVCRRFAAMKRQRQGSIVIVSSPRSARGSRLLQLCRLQRWPDQLRQIFGRRAGARNSRQLCRARLGDTEMNDPVFRDNGYRRALSRIFRWSHCHRRRCRALHRVLLSDWSRHITGEVLNVNGGAVLCG